MSKAEVAPDPVQTILGKSVAGPRAHINLTVSPLAIVTGPLEPLANKSTVIGVVEVAGLPMLTLTESLIV